MNNIPKELPFTNNGKQTIHVGGKRIAPGETRPIEATQHPNYKKMVEELRGKIASSEKIDPLLELLDLNVKELTDRIKDADAISDADLDKLEAAEQQGSTRKTAILAIQEERLARAAAKQTPDDDQINLGELLEGDEQAVLLKIATLKQAVEQGAGLTQEAIAGLLQSEEKGLNRETVVDAIIGLEPKEAEDEKASGWGVLASLFSKKQGD